MSATSTVALSNYHLGIVRRYAEQNQETVKSAIENMIITTMLEWLSDVEDAEATPSELFLSKANQLLPNNWEIGLWSTENETKISLNVGLDFLPVFLLPAQIKELQQNLTQVALTGGKFEIGAPSPDAIAVRRRGNGLVFEKVSIASGTCSIKASIPRSSVDTIIEALSFSLQAQTERESEQ